MSFGELSIDQPICESVGRPPSHIAILDGSEGSRYLTEQQEKEGCA